MKQAAVVTGASSGLGRATTQHLVKLGYDVLCYDINSEIESIAFQMGATGVQGDVCDEVALSEAIGNFCQDKPLKVSVACAGVADAALLVSKKGKTPFSHFKKVININLLGSIALLQASVDTMGQQSDEEKGVVILTASVAAFEGQMGQVAYSASKGGIVGLTLPAARECARHGIRVMTIAPGLMETPMMTGFDEKVQAQLQSLFRFPNRFGKPEEYARCVQSIVENPLLNGSVIRLDGAVRLT